MNVRRTAVQATRSEDMAPAPVGAGAQKSLSAPSACLPGTGPREWLARLKRESLAGLQERGSPPPLRFLRCRYRLLPKPRQIAERVMTHTGPCRCRTFATAYGRCGIRKKGPPPSAARQMHSLQQPPNNRKHRSERRQNNALCRRFH